MRNRTTQGFTLIELLIVIAIIGILAAVLIPNLLSARTRAFDTAANACARSIATAQEILFIDTDAYNDDSLADLNTATDDVASNCEAAWVTEDVYDGAGWVVTHPNGSGLEFTVTPGNIAEATP